MQKVDNGGIDPRRATIWADKDGVVHVRNSERGTLDKCPQRWWWAWREGLRAKETATPLWFGTAIHEALADYYRPGVKRSKDYIDKFRESADMEAEYVRVNLGGLDEDKWVDARSLGEQMLTGYVEHYGRDRYWDVIATEQSFELAIPWLDEDTKDPVERLLIRNMKKRGLEFRFFILNGTFDGVYRDKQDKRTKLMEHKTAAAISVGHLTMDNQAGTYHLVAQTVGRTQGWLGPRENIQEITYNFLRKGMPDERPRDKAGYACNKPTKAHFVLALEEAGIDWPKNPTLAVFEDLANKHGLAVVGDRSKRQPAPLYMRHPVKKTPAMRRTQLARLKGDVTEMALLEAGLLSVRKSPNRDTCAFCEFKDMCELHETQAGWVEYRNAMFRSTDPYEDHRKAA
jgi:hypothetical protein